MECLMPSRNQDPVISDVLRVLANQKSLEIFNVIASKRKVDTKSLRYSDRFNMFTNKQYHSRLKDLTDLRLVKRNEGLLSLTSFGAVVSFGKKKIDRAIEEYHNLKAIDSIEGTDDIDQDVRRELIKDIVIDDDIKRVLLGKL